MPAMLILHNVGFLWSYFKKGLFMDLKIKLQKILN